MNACSQDLGEKIVEAVSGRGTAKSERPPVLRG
jgi:hypothetical protein